jgi:hypothetical protein
MQRFVFIITGQFSLRPTPWGTHQPALRARALREFVAAASPC